MRTVCEGAALTGLPSVTSSYTHCMSAVMEASRGRAARSGLAVSTTGSARPQAAARALLGLLLLCCLSGLSADTEEEPSSVPAVTTSNWTVLMAGHWMVQFYAPWCPSCQQIKADWENFAKLGSTLDVKVAKVDVTEQPGLTGRFFVTKLPTIFHAKDGFFRRYHGSRRVIDLQSFIAEKKWDMIEPVAGWKSPSSILMTGMAGLFHLSGWIRQTHIHFTGPLGMPVWASYIIFVMITLLIGLILGLILVLLIDCFCPAKSKYEVVKSDAIQEDIEEFEKDPSDELKVCDNEDVKVVHDDEDKKDKQESNDEENKESENSDEKDSEQELSAKDSGADEDIDMPVPHPVTPESESALRQRRNEAVAVNGH